ncbi:uncharacterized protein BDR25DRAFT_358758 [Lindgomyces ingoldianus]|uniref:Uncharacterized protein n=1 Tax=Lindgomyces ingoldianus TaxID=673940 RepID=A0ACB6QM59_9PLEO|nr:uncharacterized protein BDR25DRAFT_358758 [Lindgomyces ingoldianus]KAF2467212.1 hypothetical protein BDR25DRAFT_358758 [Lindgomyces ingoldianus]
MDSYMNYQLDRNTIRQTGGVIIGSTRLANTTDADTRIIYREQRRGYDLHIHLKTQPPNVSITSTAGSRIRDRLRQIQNNAVSKDEIRGSSMPNASSYCFSMIKRRKRRNKDQGSHNKMTRRRSISARTARRSTIAVLKFKYLKGNRSGSRGTLLHSIAEFRPDMRQSALKDEKESLPRKILHTNRTKLFQAKAQHVVGTYDETSVPPPIPKHYHRNGDRVETSEEASVNEKDTFVTQQLRKATLVRIQAVENDKARYEGAQMYAAENIPTSKLRFGQLKPPPPSSERSRTASPFP